MTLTELRYVVALAQERHFGRAAAKCFVTQPTLSLALAKLEEELGLQIFERNKSEVLISDRGAAIVEQARRVLDEAAKIPQLARSGRDELIGPLKLGVIPTIGPYLLPELIPVLKKRAPQMPLEIEENLTGNLTPMLRDGDIDCAIVALPFLVTGVATQALYDEKMSVIVPAGHAWQSKKAVKRADLSHENLLLLNSGHCLRDQVVEACPGQSNTATEGRAGSSIETIRNMVASGLGISVLPDGALSRQHASKLVASLPFADPAPSRRIGIAWRESFGRKKAVDVIVNAVSELKSAWVNHIAA
jgi:LysR family transcriptional regulator, hydrogen peroxide-inducible genes activator